MAKLYITEYGDLARDAAGNVLPGVGLEPAIATQVLTYTGTSAASSALNERTRVVKVHTDAICSLRFAAAPTAVTTDPRMAADQVAWFGVRENSGLKIAAITNT